MDSEQRTKIKYSVVIGFLTLALFAMLGMITASAAEGNPVSRWILLVIFGAVAVLLASYAIGYIILTLVGKDDLPEVPEPTPKKRVITKRRSPKKKKVSKKRKAKKKATKRKRK